MKVKELIRLLEKDGWYFKRSSRSHMIFKHPIKTNTIVVASHKGDIPTGTYHDTLKQTGLD